MIAQNENQEYAAEVPFTLPLTSNPLAGLESWSFTLGEVQIKLPGSLVWTNAAVAKIVEKGYGRYCVRLTPLQTVTAGVVAIRANVGGAQPYFGVETIGVLGGDIAVGGTGYIVFYLPDENDPIYGLPISTADFTLDGLVRICLPNDVYRDATPTELASIINLGNGGYALPITPTLSATRGKIFLYVEYPNAQRFETYTTILGVGVGAGAGTGSGSGGVSIPKPIVRVPAPENVYLDHVQGALNRLCYQFRSGDELTLEELDVMIGAEL